MIPERQSGNAVTVSPDPIVVDQDLQIYGDARSALSNMATSGNPAAKDFEMMLADIEGLVGKITNIDTPSVQGSIVPWNASIDALTMMDDQIWLDSGWDDIFGFLGSE